MGVIKNLATVTVLAMVGVGAGSVSASAYSISGGASSGWPVSGQTLTFSGGSFVVSCTGSYSIYATGSPYADLVPYYSGCTFLGFPATVSVVGGTWGLNVTSGPSGGVYRADLHYGASSLKIVVPIAGCTVDAFDIAGVEWNAARLSNTGSGVNVSLSASGIDYWTSGCPFGNGGDGTFTSNGTISFPGLTVS